MNHDELTDLLRRSMLEHDTSAPTEREVQHLLPRLPETTPHQRAWWPVLLSAAVVLTVIGGSAWLIPHLRSATTPSPGGPLSNTTPTAGGPSNPTRQATIFLVTATGGSSGTHWSWRLVPHEVTTQATADPAVDALRALFTQPGTAAEQNLLVDGGEQLVDVKWVTVSWNIITVDLTGLRGNLHKDPYADSLCPAGACIDPQAMLEQIAWTVSTALRSQAPILFVIDGRPTNQLFGQTMNGPGVPNGDAIAVNQRNFAWYQQACGPPSLTAVLDGGSSVPINPADGGGARSVLSLKVGQSATLTSTGRCFRQFDLSVDTPLLATVLKGTGDRPVIVARRTGSTQVTYGGGAACTVAFGRTQVCPGPYVPFAFFKLVVTK